MSAPEAVAGGRRPPPPLAGIVAAWNWTERLLVGLLGAFAMAIAAIQVFGRYIDPAAAITWAEEVIVYAAVWAVMIVASQLVRTDGQVRPDLVLRLMPAWLQRWVEIFNCLVALAFTLGMIWYGYEVVSTAIVLDQRSSTELQFPIWVYYLALPVGGALMFGRYVIRIVLYAFFFDPATMTVGHLPAHETPADYKLPRQVD